MSDLNKWYDETITTLETLAGSKLTRGRDVSDDVSINIPIALLRQLLGVPDGYLYFNPVAPPRNVEMLSGDDKVITLKFRRVVKEAR